MSTGIKKTDKDDCGFWYDIEWQCGKIQEVTEQAVRDAFSGPKWTTPNQLSFFEGQLDAIKHTVITLRKKLEDWEANHA